MESFEPRPQKLVQNRREFLRSSLVSLVLAAINPLTQAEAEDKTERMLKILETKFSADAILGSMNHALESSSRPLGVLIKKEITIPTERRGDLLIFGFTKLTQEQQKARQKEAEQIFKESKETVLWITGRPYDDKAIIEEANKTRMVAHAIQWACKYSAKASIKEEFPLYHKAIAFEDFVVSADFLDGYQYCPVKFC